MTRRSYSTMAGIRITAPFLCALAWGGASAASFPSNPTSIAQCEAAMRRADEQITFHSRMQDEFNRNWHDVDRRGYNACKGSRDFSRCAEGYKPRVRELQEKAGAHYKEYLRLRGEAFPQNRACREAARAHEQRVEQQQRQARELERRNDDLRRQREQAQARSEAIQRQQREDLERANRQSANPQRNQPHVVGQVQPSPYDPATRNQPQAVYTPQQREAARQEEMRRQEQASREEAQALRDTIGRIIKPGATVHDTGRELVGVVLNPQNHQNAQVNNTVTRVQETNSDLGRGGPVVVGIQNDAFNAAGASHNNTVGQLEGALASTQGTAPPSRPAIALPRREGGGAALFQQAISDQTAPAGGPSQMAGGSTQVALAQPGGASANPSQSSSGGDCQQRYDAQEADFKALMERKPARSDAIQELQNLMYMASARVELLDAYCRSHARYGERQSMDSTQKQARQACQSRASNPAGCMPRRGW